MDVTTIPMLADMQGAWVSFQVEMVGVEPRMSILDNVYPFISVTDLKRLIWIQQHGNPRWAPERVFLGIRSATGIRPIEFQWPANVTYGSRDLPDPTVMRETNPALVDEMGNRRPISPNMIGSFILETALGLELLDSGVIPTVTAISLADLMPDTPEALTLALFGGYYQLYFPWLTTPGQVLDAATPNAALSETYNATLNYTLDRIKRTHIVQRGLAKKLCGDSITMNTMVRLRWALPAIAERPESLERTFYGLRATQTVPFLRFFSVGRSPLVKLALKDDGSPYIDDAKVLSQYLNQAPPAVKSSVILAKIPLASVHVERGAAFTLFMSENGVCDITLEVPQRGATYIAAVAADAQRIMSSVITTLGFPVDTIPDLRDLHATYTWTHPSARRSSPLTAAKLKERIAVLTPFFDAVPILPGEKALAVCQWRAVSNYESEAAQFAYITQMILRGSASDEESGFASYAVELSEKFGLTVAVATAVIERWAERRAEAVSPAGALAVPKHSTGTMVAISGSHPEYSIEIQGTDTIEDLQRLVSVVGVVLGASSADLAIAPTTPATDAAIETVILADTALVAAVEEAGPAEAGVELGEMDPAMAALMADLGFGGEEEEEEKMHMSDAVPELAIEEQIPEPLGPSVAPPDLEAAVAAAESECSGIRWVPGEAPRVIASDYYMERLRDKDKVLFGYSSTATGRVKAYSKSCQRRDDRQPNIMTLNEYARIKRCYEDRVRFVDLPPRKPSDLPMDPDWNPKRRVPDDYFFTDHNKASPTFGKPLWPVYGYENKTRPGEYSYMICAELWCDKENMPLVRDEFEGTQGRGFTKPPMTCPFCGGSTILDMNHPASGESVIVRNRKETAEDTGVQKVHRFIGTITRNKHPNGYPLPCCDSTPRLLVKYMKAAAEGKLKYDDRGVDLVDEEDVAVPPPEYELDNMMDEEKPMDYRHLLASMQTHYIVGNDKALKPGNIALLPPLLDRFFGQNGPQALESRGIRQTFVEGATLFVRVGVATYNRAPGLNLFSGLAPLLGFNSAEDCQRYVLSRRMIRGFESANYGSLVQEFAAKARVTEEELTKSLPGFAEEFGYKLDKNRPHVVRLYRAWSAFVEMMTDNKVPKRIRHFEHLLANPGTIVPLGLLLVVLEQKEDTIQVICPSFGIPMAPLFGSVPISFIWHDIRDETWEPIVLYNGTKEAVRFFGERSSELELIPASMRTAIQSWLRDWRESSMGCGRPAPPPHVWTPDHNTTDLPRLSDLRVRMEGVVPSALVRDRSNRLAGVLMTVGGNQLFVPCLDDGSLADSLPRIFEAESIPPVSADTYINFYTDLSKQFPGLTPTMLLMRIEDKTQIVGFLTAAGSMVPTAASAKGSIGLPEQQVDEFPWERDLRFMRPADASITQSAILEEATASVEEQLSEAYQYLRLALSRWLIREKEGQILRPKLKKLIGLSLPLYEKRMRMDILLEPLVRTWVSVEETTERKALSLLRQDCLTLKGEACSDAEGCRLVVEGKDESCLIRLPTRSAAHDPVRIFTARLSDELLRYAPRLHEILDNIVPEIRTPRGSVRVGDELFLATKPKESAQAIIERLGFTGRAAVSFPEEMLRFEGAEEEDYVAPPHIMEEAATESLQEELPDSWREKGLNIPQPPQGIEGVSQLAFAEGTGRSIETWEEFVKTRRKELRLEGGADRPLQWSQQDFYVLASLTLSNILFVSRGSDGVTKIDRWIQPPSNRSRVLEQRLFIILWGPRRLLVTHKQRAKQYRFNEEKELPRDLLDAMDRTSPIAEEEARGVTTDSIIASPVGIVAVAEESLGPEAEPEAEPEEVPELIVTEAGPKQSAAEAVVAPILQGAASAVTAASERIATAAQDFVAPIQQGLASLLPSPSP